MITNIRLLSLVLSLELLSVCVVDAKGKIIEAKVDPEALRPAGVARRLQRRVEALE